MGSPAAPVGAYASLANGTRPECAEKERRVIRVGIVDFDTSHVVQFTKRLNHEGIAEDQWVDGARVVMGCPGTSAILEAEKVQEYARTLREEHSIPLVERPEEMIGKIDAVLIESV